MQRHNAQEAIPERGQICPVREIPQDWARLIRKLRWIGMEEEAQRLEFAVSTMPLEKRGSVSSGPFSTD
jgi:hypothetical protein